MAYSRLSIAAAALLVLAIGATAARESDFGRGLKQTVTVNAASPAVSASLDASANPVSGFLGRMVSFLRSDADTLRSNLQNTASTINTNVQEIPLVATFETNLADGLSALQHNLNAASLQGQAAGQNAMDNLNALFGGLMTDGNSLIQRAQDALPPMPDSLPISLPIIGLPVQRTVAADPAAPTSG